MLRGFLILNTLGICFTSQLWFYEPQPVEEWRAARTFTCEARIEFSHKMQMMHVT